MPHRIDPATGKRIIGRPFLPGQSGNPLGGASRARRDLNAATIREMHRAFSAGVAAAINKVMRNQPAMFLKLLVLCWFLASWK